jgi:hypothetical protein
MQDQGSYVDAFEDPLLCVLVSAAKTYWPDGRVIVK